MLLRHAIGEVLRELRHEQGLSLRTVSSTASMAMGYLSEVERGNKEVGSETLNYLVTVGLGLSMYEFLSLVALRLDGGVPDTAYELTGGSLSQ